MQPCVSSQEVGRNSVQAGLPVSTASSRSSLATSTREPDDCSVVSMSMLKDKAETTYMANEQQSMSALGIHLNFVVLCSSV